MRRILLPGIGVLWSVLAAASGVRAAPASQPSVLPQHLVFVHSMMCFPLELKHLLPWHPEGYGTLYPLQYELGLEQRVGHGWQTVDIAAARAAGVDGFAVDVFSGDCKGYWERADEVGNFLIAPCLDLSMTPDEQKESVALKTIARNCALAAGHPSAARVDGALVIFTYGTNQLPPEAWQRIRQALVQQGHKTFWMPDLGGDIQGKQFSAQAITQYFPMFESGYLFGTPPRNFWPDLVALFKRYNKPFGGGLMPGYFRVGGGFDDARCTELYRHRWDDHLAAGLPWICIATWNDLQENTEIMPSSDWNLTRSELTRWYAAKFRQEPAPWNEARLYLTTPKSIYTRQAGVAEALVLNGSSQPAQVTLALVDGAAQVAGMRASATVAAGQLGAAVCDIQLKDYPARHFLRAKATLWDGTRAVTSVVSAPILVQDENVQPGDHTLYYSIPAHQALPGKVGLELRGSPVAGKEAPAQITPPSGATVHFAEVLHNNDLVKRFVAEPPYAVSVPQKDQNGAILGGSEWGFYMARVTDESLRVAYSDPIYVAPVGDLSVWEKYALDEGQGKVAHDASPYRKVAELVEVEWAKGEVNGIGACVRLNGTTSRINLPLYKTPVGPMSLSLAVRPAAFEGMIFTDSGGMWMAFSKEGRPVFTRLGAGGKWVTVTGHTSVAVGRWVKLEFIREGTALRILVNGRLDGSGTCGEGFGSGRRALGCNPFGKGSSYFAGDISNFELRTPHAR